MNCVCKHIRKELAKEIISAKVEADTYKKVKKKNKFLAKFIKDLRHKTVRSTCDCFDARMLRIVYDVLNSASINKTLDKMILWAEDNNFLASILPFIEVLATLTEEKAKEIHEKQKKSNRVLPNFDSSHQESGFDVATFSLLLMG